MTPRPQFRMNLAGSSTPLSRHVLIGFAIAAITAIYLTALPNNKNAFFAGLQSRVHHKADTARTDSNDWWEEDAKIQFLPHELLDLGVYNKSMDFQNEQGIRPPFWSLGMAQIGNKTANSSTSSIIMTMSPSAIKKEQRKPSWGPCYPPRLRRIKWKEEVERVNRTEGPEFAPYRSSNLPPGQDVANQCRPSFLIIGAGKCGTSSLYHYLVDHPRVLPAKQKQIHYFKYYPTRSLRWYYSFFPSTTSFLASGALMTGEASPGYLPYPSVPHLVKNKLPGVRILAVGRNPIERMYSSYQYNYVQPTIEALQHGKILSIPKGMDEEAYQTYLFSFEEMILAELAQVRKCLNVTHGTSVVEAAREWKKYDWVTDEMTRRKRKRLPPLADLDGFCYGKRVSSTVVRDQWTDLAAQNPDKVIIDRNVHLIQSFIGRSIYVLPLEWWYARMGKDSIYFLCTEEMSDTSGSGVAKVANFLGLPAFNFSDTVRKGAYNVGGHRGYDEEVSWDVLESESHRASATKNIPLSEDVMRQVKDFIQPYNERLFALTGRRCHGW